MSLADRLYRVAADAPTAQLIRTIEEEAAARGLTLSRWQTNRGNHSTTITYILHTGPRADQSRQQQGVLSRVTLDNLEGATAKSAAYRALTALRAEMQARPALL